jgi:hypothetical protein
MAIITEVSPDSVEVPSQSSTANNVKIPSHSSLSSIRPVAYDHYLNKCIWFSA